MSDIVNDEVEQAFREGVEYGSVKALAEAEYHAHENPVQNVLTRFRTDRAAVFRFALTAVRKWTVTANEYVYPT